MPLPAPRRISIDEWDARYAELRRCGLREPSYGGPLRRHLEEGCNRRLAHLRMDDSAASLRLWNFLLSEEDRLRDARQQGKHLVGTMKDLGTVPVLAYALENVVAFYPDGAWWLPCLTESHDGLLAEADLLGIDDSFCPVRAMLGAFVRGDRFPLPDLLLCSVGATCDDFSAIAQRLESIGYPVHWWEIPCRRPAESGETPVSLPGGWEAPQCQVDFVAQELKGVGRHLENLTGQRMTSDRLKAGIARANRVRGRLMELRRLVHTAARCPLPALEALIAEVLAIHFCSNQAECLSVIDDLLEETRARVENSRGHLAEDAVRVYWVNPVADLRVMNLLEDAGGRICGTDYMFCHALESIPEDIDPWEALARTALADPMVGSGNDRARRIAQECRSGRIEAVVVARIPGASHCGLEGEMIARAVARAGPTPILELEVPPLADAIQPALETRLEALIETARGRRSHQP